MAFFLRNVSTNLSILVIVTFTLLATTANTLAQSVPTQGLHGYWRFDEGSGTTAVDTSGNGYTATLSNALGWAAGQSGTALAPGASALVLRNAVLESPQLTFALWMKAEAAPVPYEGLAGKTSSENWNDGDGFYYVSSSEIRFFVNTWYQGVARAPIIPTTWNHLVGTYDGRTVRLYVNGVEGTATNFTGPFFHGGALLIGRLPGTSNRRHTIDDVHFYNRALSAAEVHSLYTASATLTDNIPPLRTNGTPSGALAAGTTQSTLTLSTNENATCKYGPLAGKSYDTLPNTFSTTGGLSHTVTVSGLQNGQSYTYYVRCQDSFSNVNADDFLLTFAITASSSSTTTPPVGSDPVPTTKRLTWIDSSDNEDGFKIERKVGTAGTYVRLAVVGVNTTTYTDTETVSGTVYCYHVQAFNTAGDSPFSNAACTTNPSTANVTSAPSP